MTGSNFLNNALLKQNLTFGKNVERLCVFTLRS